MTFMTPHRIGYARLDAMEPDPAAQLQALDAAGCMHVHVEPPCGDVPAKKRPQLASLLMDLREGDTLVVMRLDRLGRSLNELIEILADLRYRGIGFVSVSDEIDSVKDGGEFYARIIAALARFNQAAVQGRTKDGLQKAREEGRVGGRPPVDAELIAEAVRLRTEENMPYTEVSRQLGVSRSTIYKHMPKEANSPVTPE